MNNMSQISIDVYESKGSKEDKWAISKKLALTVFYLNKRANTQFLKNGGLYGKDYDERTPGLTLLIDKKHALNDATDFDLREPGTEEKDIERCGDLIILALKKVNIPLPENLN